MPPLYSIASGLPLPAADPVTSSVKVNVDLYRTSLWSQL